MTILLFYRIILLFSSDIYTYFTESYGCFDLITLLELKANCLNIFFVYISILYDSHI